MMKRLWEMLGQCGLSLYRESGLKSAYDIIYDTDHRLSLYRESGLKYPAVAICDDTMSLSLYRESGLKFF